MSFSDKIIYEALTYDDVLLVPCFSEVLPSEVNTNTRITPNINLHIPIVSAAMDTVTEAKLAIAMANQGGIGFIHKNMSIEEQLTQVWRVKRFQSGLIIDPISIKRHANVKEVKKLMRENNIGGIPIVDDNNILLGIITNRDIRFVEDNSIKAEELMTTEVVTATKEVSLKEAKRTLQKNKIEKLPIVDKKNCLVGLITIKDIIKNEKKPYASRDSLGRLRVGGAIGTSADTLLRLEALVSAGLDVACLDTAHGHTKTAIKMLKQIKEKFKDLEIIVGNIATCEAAECLAEAGADCVKIGVGPGSICTTRMVAGVGMPQLTAIIQTAKALKKREVSIIADGGIRYSGDITKALAAGADAVMLGSMLAGTEESPGEVIIYEGRKFKMYRGMGSIEAMKKGSKERYFQDQEYEPQKLVPEGISARVPFKGCVGEILYQLVGGVKAGMGYCGAENIKELKKSKFIKITNAGIKESHVHDVIAVREAPNYSPDK